MGVNVGTELKWFSIWPVVTDPQIPLKTEFVDQLSNYKSSRKRLHCVIELLMKRYNI
jgi:hypothetical protein